ncbi:DUF3179 domain-containing (seleno)protein [Stieleria varia]|nr:DUF3179 domain-containing (seleno)protein [Stieleria varia]
MSALLGAFSTATLVGVTIDRSRTLQDGQRFELVPPTPMEIAQEKAEAERLATIAAGGSTHSPMQCVIEFSGINDPTLLDANEVDLPDATKVIGVLRGGMACALVIDDMCSPRTHVVNMLMGNKPVSVAYCNLSNCIRVMTDDKPQWIPLTVTGLDIHNQLVVGLRGTHYTQSSKQLPLTDVPYERTTWGRWKQEHGATKIWQDTTSR